MTTSPDVLQPRVAAALAAEYEIIRPLGQGGMATVFLAREHALKRLVAIKVLEPQLAAAEVYRVRFRREAEFAASLSHPNIVPIYRVGEVGELPFYVMAFVDGEHLGDRVQREGPLPPREVLRVIRETGSALSAAHRRGLVHRDVKPHNILFEPETGRVLVTDFGIAGITAPTHTAASIEEASRLTGAGMVMGTPRYMSPEQASGDSVLAPASDFYALGVVAYEMLTGAFPYRVGTPPNFMLAHLTQTPIAVSAHVAGVPPEFETLLHGLLAKSALERISTTDELNRHLDRAEEAIAASHSGPRRPLRFGRRRWPMVAAAAVTAVVAAVLFILPTLRSGTAAGIDPRASILVGFFENRTGVTELDWLRIGAVEQLAQSLGRWREMQVVHAERLLDLARRADLSPDAPLSQEDARRIARLAGVGTAAVGTITRQGADRFRFTVRLYDVESGDRLTEAFVDAPNDSTLPAAFTLLADRILDVSGAEQGALRAANPPTTSLDAYRSYIEGIGARSRWDLATARLAFRQAVTIDPEFALAWYELSVATQPLDAPRATNEFVALADSAMAHVNGRPATERLLVEGYHALVHADMPRARSLYSQLIALDSTIADAWGGLGDAAQLDLTLRPDGAGGVVMPADLQLAVRSYQRALALDGTDHRFYSSLAGTLAKAGLDQDNFVAGYRDPPSGDITTLTARIPAAMYAALALGDSLALLPAAEVNRRFSGRQVDSLRARARARARVVADQWLAIAPDEGQAHLLKAFLQRLDRDFDGALTSLGHARRLGTAKPTSLPLVRASVLLEARRFAEAIALVDSLVAAPGYVDSVRSATPYLLSVVANARLAGGRIADAERYREMAENTFQNRARTMRSPLAPLMDMRLEAARLGIAATYDQVTPDDVRETEARFESRIAGAPDSIRGQMRQEAAAILSWIAAPVGDTVVINRWRRWFADDWETSALEALAVARSGDMTRAAQLYRVARADSSRDLSHLVALARTAATLGRGEEALAYYDRVEEHRLLAMRSTDTDWGTIVRTYRERGDIYAARGDVERAREYYGKFLAAWTRPEKSLARELAQVRKALGELTRADRGDRVG